MRTALRYACGALRLVVTFPLDCPVFPGCLVINILGQVHRRTVGAEGCFLFSILIDCL